MNTPHQFVRRRSTSSKTKLIVLGAGLLIFIVANSVVAVMYHGRTYPRTSIGGTQVGSSTYQNLLGRRHDFVPRTVTITHNKEQSRLAVTALGISVDTRQIKAAMNSARVWPPVANFVVRQTVTWPLAIDNAVFTKGFASLQQRYEKSPAPARLVMEDYIFMVKPATKAVTLDRALFREQLLLALQTGRTTVELPVLPITPEQLHMADQQYGWDELKKQQNTAVTYYYTGKSKQLTAREVGTWYVPKKDSYVLSDDKIRATVTQLGAEAGVTIRNIPEALAATKEALQSHQSLAFSLLNNDPGI